MDAVFAFLWRWLPLAAAAAALVFLSLAIRAARRKLLVDNLPTSKTTGVFMGLVEVKGRAESAQPMKSTFGGVQCVWYRFTIKERSSRRESTTDSDGRTTTQTSTDWTTIATVTQDGFPFELQDDRGSVRVLPKGATVEPHLILDRPVRRGDELYERVGLGEVAGSDGVRQIREEAIRLHSRIFVVGQARLRSDTVAAEIAADPEAPMFLISTRDEAAVSSGFRGKFWGLGAAGLAVALLGVFAWLDTHGGNEPLRATPYIRTGLGYLALWLVAWVVLLANSLIELRQRVRQAWANIDVELKRRADLLPQLAKIVSGLLEHERIVQPLLAAMRAQAGATAPGRPGADPAALSKPLRLVAEAYPALKAQALFGKLQAELALTEDRIALARGYFNEIASFFNTRIGQFPDGLLAGLLGMRAQLLMDEAGFLRRAATLDAPGANVSGPCPKCHVDVRRIAGMTSCPFCGSDRLAPEQPGTVRRCLACERFLKPAGPTDPRLAGNVLHCGHCRAALAASAPASAAPAAAR